MSLAFDESNHCHQTTLLMPPPKNIFRIGTKQCLKALKARSIELSLPEYQQDNLDDGDGKEAPFIAVGGLDEEEEEGKGGDKNNYGRLQLQEQFVVSPDDSGDDGQDETRPEDEEEVQHQESLEEEEEEEDPAGAPKENDDGSSKRKFDSISLVSHESHEKTTVEDSTPVAETVVTKYQPPDPRLPRFCDIIGHGQVKLRCEEILLPFALPKHLVNSILTGVRSMPASILFYGPPGVGKTKLASSIAGEAEAAFISVSPSDILSKFVGESEKAVRELFNNAYQRARRMESRACVLFLDEIDALGQSRGDSAGGGQAQGGDSCSRRVLAELLIQLTKLSNDRFSAEEEETSDSDQQGNDEDEDEMVAGSERNEAAAVALESANDDGQQVRVIVVAATNRPSDCDPALLRRFGVRVHVGLPNKSDRYRILKRLLKDIAHTIATLALKDLAGALEGWSGSEIENLAREAAMAPVRECIRMAARKKRRTKCMEQRGQDHAIQIDEDSRSQAIRAFENLRPVTLADFEAAVEFFSGNNDVTSNSSSSNCEPDSARSKDLQYDSSSNESDDED